MISRYQRNSLIKEFLPSILMALFSVGLVVYALIPGIRSIQEIIISTDNVNKENRLLKKKVNTFAQFDEETLTQHVSTLLSAVPSDKSISSILTTIENVASSNRVMVSDLTVVNPGSISSDSASTKINNTKLGSNTIKISTSITGLKDDIFSFITNIRKVRRLIRIATMTQTFTSVDASSSAKLKLELEAFYAPLPITLGKIESEISPLSANEEQIITKISEYPLQFDNTQPIQQGQIETGNKIDPFSF